MIKRRIAATLAGLLGATMIVVASLRATETIFTPALVVAFAAGAVLVFAAVAALVASTTRPGDGAVLPFNWFLPALRKQRQGAAATGVLFARWRTFFPKAFFSDRTTKHRGLVRRGLRALGISWLSSPVRRLAQGVCFALFLFLFFWVCWPYHARPDPPGQVSRDWLLDEFVDDGAELRFQNASIPEWIANANDVYIVAQGTDQHLLRAAITEADSTHIRLRPTASLTGGQFDELLTNPGPWSLHEKEPNAWPTHYADALANKELIPADLFLAIDPLVSLSTAIASRSWVWSLTAAAVILIVCILVPRGFCGYVCPLGTLIDLFDWAVGRRVQRFRVPDDGWWVHIKYYLLAGTLLAAAFGVLASGYFAAIPVVTRGMLFLFEPLQSGVARGWRLVPALHAGHVFSLVLFFGVLSLGFLRPRFWCKYVCPSGATFSLGNLFRATERKVESSCIHCNKCIEVCPFDAIKPDFTTRVSDCTLCQTCGGVCPTHAIKFVERWNDLELKAENDPPTGDTPIGRRGFLSWAVGSGAAVAGGAGFAAANVAWGANLDDPDAPRPVRPPGSVPEQEFLQMCIRCGECFKACPNNVLQAEGFEQGLAGLWTPQVVADWAGCESSCNACGQVCPTGAIRALPMEEKKAARMGLAIVDPGTCLPLANREACQLCVDECIAAGYDAIEFQQVHTQVDPQGAPIAGTGYLAPVVLAEKCVGCGLCQTRCHAINVKDKELLAESAIVIHAGPGREDRLMSGSYIELRRQEQLMRENELRERSSSLEFFVPEPISTEADSKPSDDGEDDPFGLEGL